MQSLELWEKLKTPPPEALKEITGGRNKGMSDISPQWRYKIMTETFGPCGIGWKFEVEKLWTEQGVQGQVFAFALVHIQYLDNNEWSKPVQGVGGSMLIANERNGPYCDDDAFKKAVTDATGTALKMIGVAADVYEGLCDSKHKDAPPEPAPPQQQQGQQQNYSNQPPTNYNQNQGAW